MMYPIAVKGHMPFSPTYNQRVKEALIKREGSRLKRSAKATDAMKIDTCSCPAIQVDKVDAPRQRSKSANFLDCDRPGYMFEQSTSASNVSNSASMFRLKLRKWFRPNSTKSSKGKSKVDASGASSNPGKSVNSTELNQQSTSNILDPPVVDGGQLQRSYSLSTPHHVPKLDAIIEEDEANAIARGHRLSTTGLKRRPHSVNIDKKSQQQHLQSFQQMLHWSDSESSCESLKDVRS